MRSWERNRVIRPRELLAASLSGSEVLKFIISYAHVYSVLTGESAAPIDIGFIAAEHIDCKSRDVLSSC